MSLDRRVLGLGVSTSIDYLRYYYLYILYVLPAGYL